MPNNAYRRNRLTDAEREQRRAAERERAKQAAERLLTSDGWRRWVRARSMFRRYSANNCMPIALEFGLRGQEPEPVTGFRTWLKLGRCVRKGEHGIRIAHKVTQRKRNDAAALLDGRCDDERQQKVPVRFTTVSVFSVSQTDAIPGAEQLPLEPPCEPLTGDSHAHLLEPLHLSPASSGTASASRRSPARPEDGATLRQDASSSTPDRRSTGRSARSCTKWSTPSA